MDKKRFYILSSTILLIGIAAGIVQYVGAFDALYAAAVNPGHTWAEIECTDTFCVDTVNEQIGIGTTTPTEKLDIVGDIKLSGDICLANGICLSSIPYNGKCGTAAKTYAEDATTYGTNTLCASGTSSPAYPVFPVAGGSTSWSCLGRNTGSDDSCTMFHELLLTWPTSIHGVKACEDLGGSVYNTGDGTMCRYIGNTIPSGWLQADNWQRSEVATWGGDVCGEFLSTAPTSFANESAVCRVQGAYSFTPYDSCSCAIHGGLQWLTATSSHRLPVYKVTTYTCPIPSNYMTEIGIY